MTKKQYICVYQDCPMCGDRGRKLKKLIFDKQLNVRKVSFASPEGKELCYEAVFIHGIKTMPFFTDGSKYAASLEELIARPRKKSTKKTTKRKTTRKKKEVEDGAA